MQSVRTDVFGRTEDQARELFTKPGQVAAFKINLICGVWVASWASELGDRAWTALDGDGHEVSEPTRRETVWLAKRSRVAA